MKKQIQTLAVVSLLLANFAKAAVDNSVQKPDHYSCQNSEVGSFQIKTTQIQFSDKKLKIFFEKSVAHLQKTENSIHLKVLTYEIIKNSQTLAQLEIAEHQVQSQSGSCGRSTRAPCNEPFDQTLIFARLDIGQNTYDFSCTKN